MNAIRQNPNLSFTTIKDNVKYTTLKDLKKKEEQLRIDEYISLHSQCGLNCVRAYKRPELMCDSKKEADIRLLKTNPINRVFKQYISKNKTELCYDNSIPIKLVQYNKTS